MPLSEEHRQALDEIERALEQEDPEFAAAVGTDHFQRLRRRWVVIPAGLFLIGAVLLVTGLVATHALPVLGGIVALIGFLAMPAAVTVFFRRHPHLWSTGESA